MSTINNILDFSKLEEGKRELECEPFDLKNCIEGAIDIVASKATEKGLIITYSISNHVPKNLMGDVISLRQILVNLLSNSVKFTHFGEISISVIDRMIDDHIQLHFSVKDTGIGIPPDRISRLFHSFSQVDMSTTRKYGGTGLGLAISKRLVELMGGKIWVESKPGIGSTFHFNIIADPATEIQPIRTILTRRRPVLDLNKIGLLHILLAEDNIVNQKVALLMLNKLGIRADTASNGFEVLEALERQYYDVILMDIQMPDMDGLQAAKAIMQRWTPKERPYIIALTAHALEGDRQKCLDAGMDDYISKPITMEELTAALCKYPSILRKNIIID
jgi:CheY-like chemotaxis protein